jgi:peptidoglycan/xylan/chitin deacetylase (PgdA/CDA1 family)
MIALMLDGFPRSRAGGGPVRVPVLMYHGIIDEPEKGHPYYQVHTAPRAFERQMQYLAQHGYHVLSLGLVSKILREKKNPPTRSVVITFDDGFDDFRQNAFPVLQRHRFPATVFLITGVMSGGLSSPLGRKHLSWDAVRELMEEGIEFGSHTVSHPRLIDCDPDAVRREIVASKEHIEAATGRSVDLFSYPFAFPEHSKEFVRMLEHTLEEAGYAAGVTTRIGRASHRDRPYLLPRLPVNSHDDDLLFRAKLHGAYDCIGWPQRAGKKLRISDLGSRIRHRSSLP